MDLQRENHSELNLAEDSRRQQRKGKGVKSSILQTEQQMSSVEIEFQKASQDLQGNDKDCCTGKLIAGILGVICLILIYSIVRVVDFIPCTVIWERRNLSTAVKMEKAYHCGRCPPEWLMYSNNCYYISTEKKTWTESLMACASKSSGLLHTDNEEERQFLALISHASWTGIFRRSSDHPWMSINGSIPTVQIIESSSGNGNCVMLHRIGLTSSRCESSKIYICKHSFYG